MTAVPYPPWLRLQASRIFEFYPQIRALRRHLRRELGTADVVEAGAGFGTNSGLCRGAYLGLERDPAMVRLARRRFPDRRFEACDATEFELRPGERYHTGLLCLALHEADRRPALLAAMTRLCCRRLLIYDFDPGLRGLRRARVNHSEEQDIRSYWGLRPESHLGPLGWQRQGGSPLGPLLRFWRFVPLPGAGKRGPATPKSPR